MKRTRYFFIILLSLTLIIITSGCNEDPPINSEQHNSKIESSVPPCESQYIPSEPNERRTTTSPSVPSPFVIMNPGNLADFKNEITTQLTATNVQAFSYNATNGLPDPLTESNMLAYFDHDVASLSEFYFVTVEVEGFELVAVEVSSYDVSYDFHCVGTGEERISISILRPSNYNSPDEVWQIVTNQLINHFGGQLTESGMIYEPDISRITARIGDTRIRIRVPDRLNNYEFLRDLAFEIIATSELIVLGDGFFQPFSVEGQLEYADEDDYEYEDAYEGYYEAENEENDYTNEENTNATTPEYEPDEASAYNNGDTTEDEEQTEEP